MAGCGYHGQHHGTEPIDKRFLMALHLRLAFFYLANVTSWLRTPKKSTKLYLTPTVITCWGFLFKEFHFDRLPVSDNNLWSPFWQTLSDGWKFDSCCISRRAISIVWFKKYLTIYGIVKPSGMRLGSFNISLRVVCWMWVKNWSIK